MRFRRATCAIVGFRLTLWDEVLRRVEEKVNPHSFATWFRPTTFLSLRESQLAIGVPNAQFKEWLAKNYQGVIGEALKDLGREEVQVCFEDAPSGSLPEDAATPTPERDPSPGLNPKYTFE